MAVLDVLLPRLGRVEDVLGEARLQLRDAFGDLHEARLLRDGQIDAREAEVPQRVLEDFLPRRAETLDPGDSPVAVVKALVLSHLRRVFAQQGKGGVVGLAQLRVVGDRVQMRHRGPCPADAIVHLADGLHDALPGGLLGGVEHLGHAPPPPGKELLHSGQHVLRADPGEGWQLEIVQQRIVVVVSHARKAVAG